MAASDKDIYTVWCQKGQNSKTYINYGLIQLTEIYFILDEL